MDLGLCGKRLESVEPGYTLILRLSDLYVIAISSPLTIELGGKSIRLSPEDDPEELFGPLQGLVGQEIDVANTDPDGALNVSFDGGGRVRVEPDPAYEAWNVSGPGGTLVVSTPGGKLAIWSAENADGRTED
ncbi:DUF6188 family protein [Mycolicibacterium sp. 050158]|uniref:DUF6188 family protein n=1 Tax=Mycolicibacterium sp. 050158 TaxID=3090602 RepID=UPI00299D4018|nr:DUF6188 family protein [Mycolicibacterium sp. 050158]MDX1888122.1 DUF6188 family protein [Mycolicibacterium sp. 050158]